MSPNVRQNPRFQRKAYTWPPIYSSPRRLNLNLENESYIHYILQSEPGHVDDFSDSDDESSEIDDNLTDEDNAENQDDVYVGTSGVDTEPSTEDSPPGHATNPETELDRDSCNDIVETFMRGSGEDEDDQGLDAVEVVSSFCRTEPTRAPNHDTRRIAIIDTRSSPDLDPEPTAAQPHGLTPYEFDREMSKLVGHVDCHCVPSVVNC